MFYAYYVFVRLCIPQFRSISLQLFDLRSLVLGVFNSILPGGMPLPNQDQHCIDCPDSKSEGGCWCCDITYSIYCYASADLRMAPRLGALVLFLAFFALLHCWLNAFAEMLRFADRMFYKVCWIGISVYSLKPEHGVLWMYFQRSLVLMLQDWWNSTSFANYYRTWNVVVHDWLYYYVYRDFLWVSTQSLDEQEVLVLGYHIQIDSNSHYYAVVTPVYFSN